MISNRLKAAAVARVAALYIRTQEQKYADRVCPPEFSQPLIEKQIRARLRRWKSGRGPGLAHDKTPGGLGWLVREYMKAVDYERRAAWRLAKARRRANRKAVVVETLGSPARWERILAKRRQAVVERQQTGFWNHPAPNWAVWATMFALGIVILLGALGIAATPTPPPHGSLMPSAAPTERGKP